MQSQKLQSLWLRVWKGEEEAVAQILHAQYERLANKIRYQIPENLARTVSEEDVMQDVFISVFRSFRSLNPCSERAFAAWLDSIARNQLTDAIRKARTKKRGGHVRQIVGSQRQSTGSVIQMVTLLFGNSLSPSAIVARDEATDALLVAVEQLPDDQRQAVQLRLLEGRSLEEVAELMDRSTDSIRNLVYRAKDHLRSKLRSSELWLEKK